MRDVRNNWTAVSTLLGLISSVYRNVYWRSNQQPQKAEPILYHWAIHLHRTQSMLNKLQWGRSRYTLLMRPNKIEAAVQWFRMSGAAFAGVSGHGYSIYNIIPQVKKENVHQSSHVHHPCQYILGIFRRKIRIYVNISMRVSLLKTRTNITKSTRENSFNVLTEMVKTWKL